MRNTGFADGYSTQDPVTAVSCGVGRGFEDKLNEGEWTRKVEIKTRKKLLAVGEARVAIF